ncbi:MAG TPA: cytochrome b [Xanthobacteraceae bacterium]|jgi:cytochrome b561|nr:cytochrome b [Xanthobacteraceae bacterium]
MGDFPKMAQRSKTNVQLTNSKLCYGAVPQALHWLTAIFVICGFLLGQFGDVLPKGHARELGLLVHMTLGQCVVVLLLVRLLWRKFDPPPPPEATPFGRVVEIAAKASHFTLYALLIVVPILGAVVQLKRGNELPFFAVWKIPSPWPVDRNLARSILSLHATLADALLILAGIHACAALVHHWIWRDRTLTRMLPGASLAPQRARRANRKTGPSS